jgi:hypothetical protein
LGTRHDIASGHNPGRPHWERRACYATSREAGVLEGSPLQIVGFTDADWSSDRDDQHSINAYIVKIGNGAVGWKSQEADVRRCVIDGGRIHGTLVRQQKELIWMIDFLENLSISVCNLMVINAENQGGITLAKNPVFHDRSKHIHIQYHYTQDLIKEK